MVEPTTSKTWGSSTRVFYDGRLQVEKIRIKAGGYSSIHLHDDKVNQFCVVEGTLTVNIFDETNEVVDVYTLGPTDTCAIDARVRHQFLAETDVSGYEMYWPSGTNSVRPDDIERFTTNGIRYVDSVLPVDTSIQYVWCCGCNRQYAIQDMKTVRIDNATRSMCLECVRITESIPLTDE
jgi:mannose-6-phosphate isomerase-like protein (cupin superfamily)